MGKIRHARGGILNNPIDDLMCDIPEIVLPEIGRLIKLVHENRIKHFIEWLEDNYGITIPDRVVQEYIKYQL